MERQEPRFDKDMQDVEFRPRSYRGPSLPSPSRDNDSLAWKIGVAVGIGVLAALLIFNAYERYQARRDAHGALSVWGLVFMNSHSLGLSHGLLSH